MRNRWVAVGSGVVLALAGCQRAPDPAPVSEALPSPPAAAEVRPPFEPPADGKLRPEQVQMYVAVRRRARALADEQKPQTGPGTVVTVVAALPASELRAARLLGHSEAEYRWVRARVAEVSLPGAAGALGGVAALVESAARRGGRTLTQKAAGRASAAPSPADEAAQEWNRKIVDPFRAELDALEETGGRPGPSSRPGA